MELRLAQEQEELRKTVGELLQKESPIRRSRSVAESSEGYSRELWQQLAEAGYLAIPFDKRYGGRGKGFLETSLVLEELARRRAPTPYLTTVVLCGRAIERWGTGEQKQEHLPSIASGKRVIAYADAERGGSWGSPPVQLKAVQGNNGFVLHGEKIFVPYAHVANLLLVVAQLPGHEPASPQAVLLLVDPRSQGISIEPLETVDRDQYHTVRFDGVVVEPSAVLGAQAPAPPEATRLINQWGAAARCAEMVGGSEEVLAMCTEFATKREQFGKPIGSFQAIQHRCADMAVDAVSARLVTSEAIWRLSEGLEAQREVSIAKAWVSEAYQRTCAAGHQIHGAIGYTRGHVMHLFYRHAMSAGLQFGDADYHRELLARDLGL